MYTNGILLDKFGYINVLKSGIDRLAISTYVGLEGYQNIIKKIMKVIKNTLKYVNLIKNLVIKYWLLFI